MGAAILDYQTKGKAGKLSILSSMFEEDEMPVKHLFRNLEEMPMLEQKALSLAKGKVLDVGACLIREKVVTFRMVKLNLLLSIFCITK